MGEASQASMRYDQSKPYSTPGAAQRRVEEIYVCLRNRICLLRYPPGTKLSEPRLAKEFDVSRTPIRRVLHRLELEHLAERRQGVQTVVTSFDFESVRDVYAIRMILAESVADLSPEDLWWERVGKLQDIRRRAIDLMGRPDLENFGGLHLELQEELAGVIENDRAREITMQLYFQIARIWLAMVPKMDWEEEVKAFVSEIDALIAAMKQKDICALGRARKVAISFNIERMREIMASS